MEINMIVEIPKGSRVKYEVDKDTGVMRADRLVPMPYPESYGYIPNTLADDNDPLDIFLLSEHALAPGTIVKVQVLGMIEMMDNGEKDHKILATWHDSAKLEHIDVIIKNVRNFLTVYKPNVELGFSSSFNDAMAYIKYCQGRYEKKI